MGGSNRRKGRADLAGLVLTLTAVLAAASCTPPTATVGTEPGTPQTALEATAVALTLDQGETAANTSPAPVDPDSVPVTCADLELAARAESETDDGPTATARAQQAIETATAVTTLPQLEALRSAYEEQSESQLRGFFEDWHADVEPRRPADLSRPERELHAAFRAFYTPLDLGERGGSEWGSDVYADVEYVVVQTSIRVICSDVPDAFARLPYDDTALESILDEGEITDFLPVVDVEGAEVVYLTPDYRRAIEAFLEGNFAPPMRDSVMQPAQPAGTSGERQAFLESLIHIIPGHWGGYWHIETHPEVSALIFDPNMTQAVAFFRTGYQGGQGTLHRTDSGWEVTSAELTWIE